MLLEALDPEPLSILNALNADAVASLLYVLLYCFFLCAVLFLMDLVSEINLD